MPADPVDEAVDRLYGLPLDEFIPERGATAKALRKAGEKDAAAQVAKLQKPSQVAWAANQLAREGADELLEAGEALREAQLGGGGRDAVREAAAAEREAVDALLARAAELRPLSRDASDRLRALLHAVAGDEELREQFAAGRLVAEPAGGGGWPGLGGFDAPPAESTPASKGSTKAGGGRKAASKSSGGGSKSAGSGRGAGSKSAEGGRGAASKSAGSGRGAGSKSAGSGRGAGSKSAGSGRGAGSKSAGGGAASRRGRRAATAEDRAQERRDRERRERERKAAERQEREAARRREEAERRKLERRLANARRRAEAARERLEAARDAYESAVDEVARIEEQMP